jgi:predicted GIY-YIG superfamily endonuclease
MHNMKTAWVYILECTDGSYRTGSTTDLETRIAKHQAGFYGGYTAARLPIKLVWSAEFPEIKQAIMVEWQIKGWSTKRKKR